MYNQGIKVSLLLWTVVQCIPMSRALYEKEIKSFLETWRFYMCHPLANDTLPAVDPFVMGPIEYGLHDDYHK